MEYVWLYVPPNIVDIVVSIVRSNQSEGKIRSSMSWICDANAGWDLLQPKDSESHCVGHHCSYHCWIIKMGFWLSCFVDSALSGVSNWLVLLFAEHNYHWFKNVTTARHIFESAPMVWSSIVFNCLCYFSNLNEHSIKWGMFEKSQVILPASCLYSLDAFQHH